MKFNKKSFLKICSLTFFIVALGVGSFIRYKNLFNVGFYFDTVVTQYDWATNAHSMGVVGFWRDFPGFFDYLPGALYLLAAVKQISLLLGGDVESFVLILKSINWVADVALIALLYYIGRRYGRYTRSQLFAFSGMLYLLPAIWFVSGVWGQIDTLLVFFTLLSVALLFRGIETNTVSNFYKSPVFYSGVSFALALWLKLQAVLLLPVLILFYICTRDWKVLRQQLAGFLGTTILALAMPLVVNAGRVGQNIIVPYIRGDEVSRKAGTLWGLLGFTGKGSDPIFLIDNKGISIAAAGMLVYVICMVAFTIKYLHPDLKKLFKLKNPFPKDFSFFDFLLFMTVSSSLYFILFTKMHSRYLHMGLLFAFATCMAIVPKRKAVIWFVLSLVLSLSYFWNQIYVYIADDVAGPQWIRDVYYWYKGNAFLAISMVNLLCIVGLFVWGWYAKRHVPLKKMQQEELL